MSGPQPPVSAVAITLVTSAAPAISSAPAEAGPAPAKAGDDGVLTKRSHRRSENGACPDYARGMALGRKRTAAGDYQGALEAFDEALRARPVDARAWAELGYAALLAGKDAGIALLRARSLTKDKALLAQVWFNEGLFRARRGDKEGARLAFVLAEANGSQEATKRLEGASRCAATWEIDRKGQEALTIVRSWRGVYDELDLTCLSAAPPPSTEAEAKRAVCFGCTGYDTKGTQDACSGDAPWRVDTGYMHFHTFGALIQPLQGGSFYVERFSDGGRGSPVERSGDAFVRETQETSSGEEVTLPEPDSPRVTNMQMWSDDAPDEGGQEDAGAHCEPILKGEVEIESAICAQCGQPIFPLRGPRELHYYSLRTGKELLRLSVWSGDVKATVRGATATIAGGGCQATVAVGAP